MHFHFQNKKHMLARVVREAPLYDLSEFRPLEGFLLYDVPQVFLSFVTNNLIRFFFFSR